MEAPVVYDRERIGSIIADINRYLKDFGDLKISGIGDLSDKRTFYAASMILFSLLNRVFDLGNEMVVSRNLGMPSTCREIFSLLEWDGVITPELSQELRHFVTYHNLLSCKYHGITRRDILAIAGKSAVIREFVTRVRELVRDNGGEDLPS